MKTRGIKSTQPWIVVRPDREMRYRSPSTLNRLPDTSDWGVGEEFSEILRRLGQPVVIHRKAWEYAICIKGLEQLGCLKPAATAIGIGSGSEPPLFEFANRISRVVATDLYENPGLEGDPAMLTTPERFAPFVYRRENLEVYKMAADQLLFEENEFDFSFSLSSIEHFGSRSTQREAFEEMVRVVRPGGVICLTTELVLTGHKHNEYFQLNEIEDLFLNHPGVKLVGGEVDLSISSSLVENTVDPRDSRTQQLSPHIVLEVDGMKWTSLSLFFEVC